MPIKCDICHDNDQKYKCPVCQIPYCSVKCFKIHKVRCGETQSGPSTTSETPRLDVPSSISSSKKKAFEGITRSLESLRYPPEPQDTSVFDDPLRAEEVKPLRRQDHLNLAKSQDLRRILALPRPEDPPYAHPTTHIRSILATLAGIKDLQQREQYLAMCLGLEEELHRVRAGGNQHQQQGRGGVKGGKGGKKAVESGQEFHLPVTSTETQSQQGNRQKQGKTSTADGTVLYIGAQEQQSMRAFAEVVRRVLEGDETDMQARGAKRKMEWEA